MGCLFELVDLGIATQGSFVVQVWCVNGASACMHVACSLRAVDVVVIIVLVSQLPLALHKANIPTLRVVYN